MFKKLLSTRSIIVIYPHIKNKLISLSLPTITLPNKKQKIRLQLNFLSVNILLLQVQVEVSHRYYFGLYFAIMNCSQTSQLEIRRQVFSNFRFKFVKARNRDVGWCTVGMVMVALPISYG